MTTPGNRDQDSTAKAGDCCGHTPAKEDLASAPDQDVAECPVMVGTPVLKSQAEELGLYRDHDGQRYWLCCDSCGPLFDADPERYATA
ncbi:YHS domain-containing protein [Nocardiopsis exhalans]|uniref:YHS domain-containing protein n=2 Tax=Nocardiopsis TaxID=2013 RepID=A0A840W870_9ACTN|nr:MULTISPECIES: YHS domain-containing protein [Nocardiopsis]MBB5492244.1 YHS domain-containing protein [Nocardiopsis metallicus]USY18709.1 YHS domain-containing protein [Nocardiopsis exhalans]